MQPDPPAKAMDNHVQHRSSPCGEPPALFCPVCHTPWRDHPFCPQDGTLQAPGVVIGERYELERLIGAGGMGFVFAGRHTLLGKPVAIKVLRAELGSDADHVGRFLREAQLCSQIRHENIVEITDFGRDPRGHLFLVMNLLVGMSLSELLSCERRVPLHRVVKILRQLCRALSCAHAAGVIHRDLTPRNIFLVTESGRADVVKLLDFGVSRAVSGSNRITSTGVAVGTTPYMPPEQLRGAVEQDQRVDIYALGVIAYELLTGALPFRAQTAAELIAEKLTQQPVDLRGTDLSASAPAVARLVSECLAPNPRQRPATASEVEQRLFSSGGLQTRQDDDLEGTRVGSYRLVRLMGAGGVGSVWLGEHPVIGSQVAIKILHPQMCESEEAVRRFVVEAQAVNRIDSPYIIKTFDFGKLADGRDYAVMELLQGQTLGERIASGPLPWRDARPVALALARALVSAHEGGIVHRDLKPENIHVGSSRDDPAVKVLDFGIAKLLDSDVANTHRTKLGVCIGTPLYASPEQLTGQQVGTAADVYALGAVIFEMLTGEPPFGGTMRDLVQAKLSQVAPHLAERVADLPPIVEELVRAMLAARPEDRPGAPAVLSALQHTPVVAAAAELDEAELRLASAETRLPPAVVAARGRDGSVPSLTSIETRLTPRPPAPLTGPDPQAVIFAPGVDPAAALRLSEAETSVTPLPGASATPITPVVVSATGDTSGDTTALRSRTPLLLGGVVIVGAVLAVLAVTALIVLFRTRADDEPARPSLAERDPRTTPRPASPPLARAERDPPPAQAQRKMTTAPSAAGSSTARDAGRSMREGPAGEQLFWIRSAPPGARVTLGAEVLGRTPVRIRLDARVRTVTITLSKPGYLDQPVQLRAGGPQAVNARLQAARGDWVDPYASPRAPARKGESKGKVKAKKVKAKAKLVNPFDE